MLPGQVREVGEPLAHLTIINTAEECVIGGESAACERVIADNRKAFHDYHIVESFEAGVVLVGTEVKALREGQAQIKDGYAQVRDLAVQRRENDLVIATFGRGFYILDDIAARLEAIAGAWASRSNTSTNSVAWIRSSRSSTASGLI